MHALRLTQLAVEARHILERPRRRLARKLPSRWPGVRQTAEFGDHALDFARQLRRAAMKLRFERREARLGAVEPVLRRICGGDAHLRQVCSLLDQLFDRRFVDLPQRIPLLLDEVLEVREALRCVLLQLRACVAKRAKVGFELTDRSGVAVGRDRPSLQNRRAEFGERRQTLFEWTPFARSTDMLDLLLQTRETLLKSTCVLQWRPVRAWYTNPSDDPTTLPSSLPSSRVELFFLRGVAFRR